MQVPKALMKLTMNVSLPENGASEYLLILVDQDQLQTAQSIYQISDLEQHIQLSQFKMGLAELLPLVGKIAAQPNSALVGIEDRNLIKPAKLAKIADIVIKNAQ